jgi:nucleoside-diphosphate-sugar epimerase
VNIGATRPISVNTLIETLEKQLGITLIKTYEEASSIEVPLTHCDSTILESLIGPVHLTPFETSLEAFTTWFKEHKPYAYLDPFID